MANLPGPITNTDVYLHHIVGQLDDMMSLLRPDAKQESNAVQLREPIDVNSPPQVGSDVIPPTKIPDDFPSAMSLRNNDIRYIEDVPESVNELIKIPGIGKAKADAILDALSKV